jgi:hypothetical protein
MSQRASYIGAIRADQTVESDHSDLLVQLGTRLPGHVLLQKIPSLHEYLKCDHLANDKYIYPRIMRYYHRKIYQATHYI